MARTEKKCFVPVYFCRGMMSCEVRRMIALWGAKGAILGLVCCLFGAFGASFVWQTIVCLTGLEATFE